MGIFTKLLINEFKLINTTIECFVELPNYVLEGIALALETDLTIEECKFKI